MSKNYTSKFNIDCFMQVFANQIKIFPNCNIANKFDFDILDAV